MLKNTSYNECINLVIVTQSAKLSGNRVISVPVFSVSRALLVLQFVHNVLIYVIGN